MKSSAETFDVKEKPLAKALIKSLAKSAALGVLRLFSPGLGQRASILMYHSVGDNPAFFTVEPEEFERQMRYLSEKVSGKCLTLVPMSELVRKLRAGESVAGHVAVTFDDAYEDVYRIAFPILKKYSIPATVFVPTGLIGKFLTASGGVTLPVMNEEMMKEMARGAARDVADNDTSARLVEFMPHGVTHREFTSLSTEELAVELSEPQLALRAYGSDGAVIAYPRGKHDGVVVGASREFYQAGVTVTEGLVRQGDDLYRLRRNSIDSSTTFWQFKAKLSGAIALYQEFKEELKVSA